MNGGSRKGAGCLLSPHYKPRLQQQWSENGSLRQQRPSLNIPGYVVDAAVGGEDG